MMKRLLRKAPQGKRDGIGPFPEIQTSLPSSREPPPDALPRDDLLPDLRLTHYRKRAVIAYRVSEKTVSMPFHCARMFSG